MEIRRIITHNDFDGVVSGAIASKALQCEKVIFTGPNSIARADISIGPGDLVCDLPYPLECGMWFDHHPGNLESLKLRGIDVSRIRGRFSEEPSCARVIFGYFKELGTEFPGHFEEMVAEADMIDSFNYTSVEEWRKETPGKLVDMSMKAAFDHPRDRTRYLGFLVDLLRENPLEVAVGNEEVRKRIERYRREEEKMLAVIEQSVSFVDEDEKEELIILDLTNFKRPPRVIKNLAYLLHPSALGVVSINNLYSMGRKTNDMSIAISLSMNMTGREHGKDVGEILRRLNIGDGHRGAAAGLVHCSSKEEMLRRKKEVLVKIWNLWKSMPGPSEGEASC